MRRYDGDKLLRLHEAIDFDLRGIVEDGSDLLRLRAVSGPARRSAGGERSGDVGPLHRRGSVALQERADALDESADGVVDACEICYRSFVRVCERRNVPPRRWPTTDW